MNRSTVTIEQLKQINNRFYRNGEVLIDIDKFNGEETFCIDNYKKNNNLHNSDLRNEFNFLCKGKTESKTINKENNYENNKIFLCKQDQIRDIPHILSNLFENPSKYYIYGTPNKYSFYYSLLYIIDNEFFMLGSIHKEKKIDECKNLLVFNLDSFYTKMNYKEKRLRKSVIRENLLNSDSYIPQVIMYICDYYNLSLLVIDTDTYLYSLLTDYKKDGNYILMLKKNNYYQPILNVGGNNHFPSSIISNIDKILKPEFEINFDRGLEKTSNVSMKLKSEKSYKITELQEMAKKLDICIYRNDNSKKKKLKSDLYQEIKNA